MLSSTSNSNARLPDLDPGRTVLGVVLVASLLLLIAEVGLRVLGYGPAFLEDRDSWSQRRLKIESVYSKRHVLVLGASRAQTDISPPVLAQSLPGYGVTMLAVSGARFDASLEDVALNTRYRGIVLISATADNYLPNGSQAPWIQHYREHYRHGGRLERGFNRDLKSLAQTHLVVAHPPVASLVRSIKSGVLSPRGTLSLPSGQVLNLLQDQPIGFQREVLAKRTRRFEAALANGVEKQSTEPWVRASERYRKLISRIQARGGRVVFFVPPTSDARLEYARRAFPREEFVDLIPERTGAELIHFADHPQTRTMRCPDSSHLAPSDAQVFTRVVAQELQRQEQLLPNH